MPYRHQMVTNTILTGIIDISVSSIGLFHLFRWLTSTDPIFVRAESFTDRGRLLLATKRAVWSKHN